MKKLYLLMIPIMPACATIGELLPGGEDQAVAMGEIMVNNGAALAEQGGMIATMMSGNPELGGAVTALLTGAAGLFAAKKYKANKAAKAAVVVPEETAA